MNGRHQSKKILGDFCHTTTIHGPVYLSDGPVLSRLLWAFVMIVMFVCVGVLIKDVILEWEEQPVVMNFGLKSVPITDVPVRISFHEKY